MSNQTSTSDIAAYLIKVKRLLSAGKYDFVPRRKNMQALAKHGLTISDAKNEIFGLVAGDYYKGPSRILIQTVRVTYGNLRRMLTEYNST